MSPSPTRIQRQPGKARAPTVADPATPTGSPRLHRARQLQQGIGNARLGRMGEEGGLRVQPKLTVGATSDPAEQEADRVATTVMRMPEGACCPACADGKPCATHGGAKAPGLPLRRMPAAPDQGFELDPRFEPTVRRATSGGEPLPDQVRAKMEPRFGQDLSNVRIHRDAEATDSAQALGAQAFNIGRDIAFGPGRYAPETVEGSRLLAHELTHVLQQSGERAPEAPLIYRRPKNDKPPPLAELPSIYGEEHAVIESALGARSAGRLARGEIFFRMNNLVAAGLSDSAFHVGPFDSDMGRFYYVYRFRDQVVETNEHKITRSTYPLGWGKAPIGEELRSRLDEARGGQELSFEATGKTLASQGPLAKVVNYDAFTKKDGDWTHDQNPEVAKVLLDDDRLDQIYIDADSGNPRARKFISLVEKAMRDVGDNLASQSLSADCLVPVYRDLKGECNPNISAGGPLAKGWGGMRLRDQVAIGYFQTAVKLNARNEIIVNGLNLIAAGWMARGALAAEAKALGVKPPGGKVPPEPLSIPSEMMKLESAEIARRLGYPTPESKGYKGYYWTKTRGGNLTLARKSRTSPKLRYDPVKKDFVPVVPEAAPALVPAAEKLAAEYESLAKQAADARAGIPEMGRKTGARAPDGTSRTSGWGSDISTLDDVRRLANKIGYEPKPNTFLDAAGHPGSYNLSHAEKQLAAASNSSAHGVSRVMCWDCQAFYSRLAVYRGRVIVVADPSGLRLFLPDGTVVRGATPAAMAAAATREGESE
jgi:hypothetical protein